LAARAIAVSGTATAVHVRLKAGESVTVFPGVDSVGNPVFCWQIDGSDYSHPRSDPAGAAERITFQVGMRAGLDAEAIRAVHLTWVELRQEFPGMDFYFDAAGHEWCAYPVGEEPFTRNTVRAYTPDVLAAQIRIRQRFRGKGAGQ
jgi:hypothetical protein